MKRHSDPVPTTAEQLEELLEVVFHQEHRHRRGFQVMDGVTEYVEHAHRCALPVGNPVNHQSFDCPECHRRWECRWLSTHWLPVEG